MLWFDHDVVHLLFPHLFCMRCWGHHVLHVLVSLVFVHVML